MKEKKEKWKIALAQLSCEEGNKEKNLAKIEQSIEEAYLQKIDILILPEMFLTGFVSREQMEKLAESREGESIKRIQRKLKDYPIHLVYTFPEYSSDGLVYNTTCIINKNRTPQGYYRKIHLFDEERYQFDRGNEWAEVSIDGIKIGLLTCYDIEFPEAARTLALKGVKLLIVPSANMTPYEERHRVFITSRALENHVFVAYCNRVGKNKNYRFRGQSAVITPEGKILMELESDQEMIQAVEIPWSEVEKSKKIFNYIEERRPELYG